MAKYTAEEYICRINEVGKDKFEFVGWDTEFKNSTSKAILKCIIDDNIWVSAVNNTVNGRKGCPKCAKRNQSSNRRSRPQDVIRKINEVGKNDGRDFEFVRFVGEYTNSSGKVILKCNIDGHEWTSKINNVMNSGKGCPMCFGNVRWGSDEYISRMNIAGQECSANFHFVRWDTEFKNIHSIAVCVCNECGIEWKASARNISTRGIGCKTCSNSYGFDVNKPAHAYLINGHWRTITSISMV